VKLVAVAYSQVDREWFATEEAYLAEKEVEDRSAEVLQELEKLKVPSKGYPADQYFFTNILVDDPEIVLNLVDTLRGKDSLQTTVPAALELANIPYTGAGMQGLVIGNNRNLFKQLLIANEIPTPPFQLIRRRGTKVDPALGLPLIVKLNEGGGSVGIDNNAVKEKLEDAEEQVNNLIETYKLPVIVEKFIDGPEVTVCAFDDGKKIHIFMAEKVFGVKPDGKHAFTSIQSYDNPNSYKYKKVADEKLAGTIETMARRTFGVLHNRDYSKFDVRVDAETMIPYFTDCNPNTAFGPDKGLPFTEVLAMHGVKFQDVLASLISKYAKKI
jgi:D-alanine-D-alanine ligase